MPATKVYNSDTDKLEVYKNRVTAGERHRDKWKSEAEDNIDRYMNEYTPISESLNSHSVQVPTGTGVIDTMFASLTAVDVEAFIDSLGTGTSDQARVAEKAIMAIWEEAAGAEEVAGTIKDAQLCSIGWVKIGYDYYEVETSRPRSDDDIAVDVDRIFQLSLESGLEPPAPEVVADLVPTIEEVTEVQRDNVVIDYVPWNEVIYDPTAKRWEDVRWVCQVSKVPVDDVHSNTRFWEYVGNVTEDDNKESRKRKTSAGRNKVQAISGDSQLDDDLVGDRDLTADDEMVTLHIMFDFETGTNTYFVKDTQFVLLETPNPFALKPRLTDRSPFVPLILRRAPGRVRGVADMQVISKSLDELQLYRSEIATWLSFAKSKLFGPDNAFTDAGKEALESPEWGEYVGLEAGVGKDQIGEIKPPTLPPEIFAMQDRIMTDILEGTGVSELMRGLFPDRKRTATETVEVVSASNARQSEKRNLMERFYSEIFKRILFLIQMFYDQGRIVRLSDADGDVLWNWTAEDLAVDMTLRVELAPKEPKNFQTRKENAFMVLNVLGALPGVNMQEVIVWALQEMGIPFDVVRKFVQTDEEKQQAELAEQQRLANESSAQEGVMPDPAAVAGPLASDELTARVNVGESPAEMDVENTITFE